MTLIIRQFQPSDFDFVLKLHVDGLNQFNASIGDPHFDKDINHIESTYLSRDGDFLVGELFGRIISMGAYRRHDLETAEIKRIRVAEGHRKKGYGQLILSSLEERIKERGFKRIILDTTANQVPAQRLFEKNGYSEFRRKEFDRLVVIFYEKNTY